MLVGMENGTEVLEGFLAAPFETKHGLTICPSDGILLYSRKQRLIFMGTLGHEFLQQLYLP